MLCINLPKKAAFTEKDVAVHDRLVVGLKDRERSEKLQLQPDLTLKAALTRARQHEQVKLQLTEQRSTADAVQSGGGGGPRGNVLGGAAGFQGSWGGGSGFHRGGRHSGDGSRGGDSTR